MKKTERSKPSAGRTSRASYRRHPMSLVQRIAVTASAVITFAILVALLAYILIMGVPNLKPSLFAWHYTSDNCSMTPAIINTLLMVVLSLLLSVPFGIGAAIYLVEYAKRGNKLVKVVRLTAETLSGIPSIVYGLFGYLMFVIALNMDKSMLAGALTLAIMVLPTILRTTEEALKSVPDSFREGSFGLGAGKLRTVFRIVLPSAVPGIFSGIILAIGRIVGETAALSLRPVRSAASRAVSWNPAARWRCTCTACSTKACTAARPMPRPSCCWSWSSASTRCPAPRQSELPGARSERNRKEFPYGTG